MKHFIETVDIGSNGWITVEQGYHLPLLLYVRVKGEHNDEVAATSLSAEEAEQLIKLLQKGIAALKADTK